MENQDLDEKVARTIEKYLKNRFSEEKAQQQKQQARSLEQQNQEYPLLEHQVQSPASQMPPPPPPPPKSGTLPATPPQLAFITPNIRPCCATIRDDLKYLAMGFENSQIHLWNIKHNENVPSPSISIGTRHSLFAHSGPVYSIRFLKNDLMLSASEDTTIRLWCLNTLENLNIYRGHAYPIWCLELSPLGGMFASGSMDATARLWTFDRMAPIRILSGHDEDVECIKFHPNEKYVASGSTDKTIRLWNVADGKMVRVMVGHKDHIIYLSFLPNGKFLASTSCDGCLKIWNLSTNIVSNELQLPPCKSLSFDFEQMFLASIGVDNVLRVWKTNNEFNAIETTVTEVKARDKVTFFDTKFSPKNLKMLFVFGFNLQTPSTANLVHNL